MKKLLGILVLGLLLNGNAFAGKSLEDSEEWRKDYRFRDK